MNNAKMNKFVCIEEILQKYHELCLSEFTYCGLDDMNKMVKLLKVSKEIEEIEQHLVNTFKEQVLNSENNYHINFINDSIINTIGILCSIHFGENDNKNKDKNEFIVKYINNYITNFYRPIILFNHSINIFFYDKNDYNNILKFLNSNINNFENKEYIKKFKSFIDSFIH